MHMHAAASSDKDASIANSLDGRFDWLDYWIVVDSIQQACILICFPSPWTHPYPGKELDSGYRFPRLLPLLSISMRMNQQVVVPYIENSQRDRCLHCTRTVGPAASQRMEKAIMHFFFMEAYTS
jgi:hypothetical protein